MSLRTCDFCGEAIQSAAKKCRHCGETLDLALRAAEEAARLATVARPSAAPVHVGAAPVIIHNTTVSSATATAKATIVRSRATRGGCGCLLLMLIFFLGLFMLPSSSVQPRAPVLNPVAPIQAPPVPGAVDVARKADSPDAPDAEIPASELPIAKDEVVSPEPGASKTTNVKTLMSMGRALEARNPKAARAYYERVVKQFPESSEAKDAKKRLASLSTKAP